jgi:hypothetical protein
VHAPPDRPAGLGSWNCDVLLETSAEVCESRQPDIMRIEAGIAFFAFWSKLSRFLADGRFLDEERVTFFLDLDFESSCDFFDCCFFLLVPGGLEDCLVLDLLRLPHLSLGLDLLLTPLSSLDVAFGRELESATERPAPPPPSRLPLLALLLISLPRLLLSRLGGGGGGLLRII